jgi:hypothetical protein
MRFNRLARVAVILGGLTSLGSILASIFGAKAILLAVGSTIFTVIAARGTVRFQARQDDMRTVEALRQERLERQQEAKRSLDRAKLDRDCAELLRRAEAAVRTVLASDARAENLLNHLVDENALRDCVQAIADLAFEVTDLRAELRSISAQSLPEPGSRPDGDMPAGPLTADAIKPGQRAILIALESAEERLLKLEHYALSVSRVDAMHRDWIGTQKAERLNSRFREIVAKTAADELAAKEFERLTENAAEAARSFRMSVQEANLAGEILALPDAKGSGSADEFVTEVRPSRN